MHSLSVRLPRFVQVSCLSLRHLALVGLLALFGLSQGFAQATAAPQSHPAAAAPSAAEEQETAPAKDDASHQGIKVHGHWKIVVKNPDGSVAHTHEFENSLVPTGGSAIANLFFGNQFGTFAIKLTSTGTTICPASSCYLVPNEHTYFAGQTCGGTGPTTDPCSYGMTTTLVSGPPAGVVLSGQLTASQGGTITTVGTYATECPSTVTQANCAASINANGTLSGWTIGAFTATNVNAIAVNAGQIVQVTVTISFS